MGVKEFLKSRSGLRVDNRATTSAATLTLRQSLWPLTLVTTLFFLWVCYGISFIASPPTKTSIRALRMVCWTPSTHISRKPYISTVAAQLVFKQPTLGMESLDNICIIKKDTTLTKPSAYPLASLGYANWILRNYGYKTVFIFGLCLYGIGALCMWPAGLNQSFGGFCGATLVIGSGLGSLETAANPYLTGKTFICSTDN